MEYTKIFGKRGIAHPGTYWRTIGIAGTARGTGTTHLGILMANYMSGVWRKKTAILEWKEPGECISSDFESLEYICRGRTGKRTVFRIFDVDYYKSAGEKELLHCMNRDYEVIILDFGKLSLNNKAELCRCDKKIITGSVSEWKIESYLRLIKEMKFNAVDKSWKYCASFGCRQSRREAARLLKVSLLEVPFSVDTFCIDWKVMKFMEQLLK